MIDASFEDKLPYADGMNYRDEGRCLPDTRIEFLKTIKNCIDNEDGNHEETRIFLLVGPAGSGKSAIAHSIAFHYDQKGLLFSSFFFSRDKMENSKAHRLLRNIAKDMASKNSNKTCHPSLRSG